MVSGHSWGVSLPSFSGKTHYHGGQKILHACRKLLGNYFGGFQVIITCSITSQNSWGIIISAFSGNLNLYYMCRIVLLPGISPKSKNYLGASFFTKESFREHLSISSASSTAKKREESFREHLWMSCTCRREQDRPCPPKAVGPNAQQKIPARLILWISGNNYLFHYLSKILGN